tara:strand:- start:105 stop:359 length:255 start_codon:yes stop_codon:yes gene_type:complete
MEFKLPWSYWLKKQRKDKPPRPILATDVTYEEELLVEIALRVVMKNSPDAENVGDLLSSLARENFQQLLEFQFLYLVSILLAYF